MKSKVIVGIAVLAALTRSEEHTSELQSRLHLVCRLLLEKKKKNTQYFKWGSCILNIPAPEAVRWGTRSTTSLVSYLGDSTLLPTSAGHAASRPDCLWWCR